MAVKKSKPATTAATKATSKTPAAKPKKASAVKAKEAAPVAAPETAVKAPAPAPKKAAAVAPKKAASAAPKKAAAPVVKLTENQLKFLKQIQDTKEGFLTAKKAELKTLETLLDKKLIKKGAKDKASGSFRYTVSKAGEKHLSTIPPA